MQKQFIKKMLLFISAAAVLTIGIVFFMQGWIARSNMEEDTAALIGEVGKKLAQNQQNIKDITEALNRDGLVKAKSFAYIVAQDSSVLADAARLDRIKGMLNVDGLCISDEKGILRWGTNYIGFDLNSTEQSKVFMPGVADKNFELAQPPQRNGADNQLMQYIGIARQDQPGVIQIELRSERLAQALEQNEIQNILGGFVVSGGGFLIAVDKAEQVIAAHKNTAWVGKSAREAGLPEESEGSGFIDIDEQSMFYTAGNCGAWTIYSVVPTAALYQDRNLQVFVFLIAIVLIFALLVYLIDQMLKNLIVSGIEEMEAAVNKITSGDLKDQVDIRNTQEFERLSRGLNEMVNSIKQGIEEMKKREQETQNVMEDQKALIQGVQNSFDEIASFSQKMSEISRDLRDGAGKQSAAMQELTASVNEVSKAALESAAAAEESAAFAQKTEVRMENNKVEMVQMLDAMQEINDTSAQIGQVIETVNSIAEQTNILSINASIEAARAGDSGKGFAVVAAEVGSLAAQSAAAVQETQSLIANALQKNKMGTEILDRLSRNFVEVVEESKQTNTVMKMIGVAANGAATQLEQIMDSVHEVTGVARQTENIAENSAQISEKLLDQAQEIHRVIHTYKG